MNRHVGHNPYTIKKKTKKEKRKKCIGKTE